MLIENVKFDFKINILVIRPKQDVLNSKNNRKTDPVRRYLHRINIKFFMMNVFLGFFQISSI